jgi:ATP-dependent DNA helicase RecG
VPRASAKSGAARSGAAKAGTVAAATAPVPAAPAASPFPVPEALAKPLRKLGLVAADDFVLHLPIRYEDETRRTPIAECIDGPPVCVEGVVQRTEVAYRPRRQLVTRIADDTGDLTLRFFNFYPSQQKALAEGVTVRAFGEVRGGLLGAEMVHPRFRVLKRPEPLPTALTPVYPTTAGVAQYHLRTLIGRALAVAPLDDTLPEALRSRLDLMPYADAVRLLHNPPPDVDTDALVERTHPAWRRVKFDELLGQQLSMRTHYRARQALRAPALAARGTFVEALRARLPFALTRAQARAFAEIERDLARGHPMNRLLQGDVGSGKTIVAALAALRAVENGWQAAVMAPTEILAEQHYRKFSEWLEPLGIAVRWLSGSQKKAERKAAAEAIAAGDVPVAVGTHALFQDQVRFARLALAIVDEQHRFGVRQRLALREKGGRRAGGDAGAEDAYPHQLMMSATPIPRTLSMSHYADLDVSTIDELPPGRSPIVTKLVAATRRDEVMGRVRAACADGRQAYWVCPLVEQSEELDLQNAVETHARLVAELPGLAVGLVHGRMPPADKAAVMAGFKSGAIQLLVATTVIEVGVDVPNASLMVIEHAERFGLAQLHQLRGRVGRGAAASICLLMYDTPLSGNGRARLKVIYEETDGFRIAQEDLALRGPGEYLGARQSGAPLLRYADLLADEDLLAAAREAADRLLDRAPERAAAHMARWMAGRAELLRA